MKLYTKETSWRFSQLKNRLAQLEKGLVQLEKPVSPMHWATGRQSFLNFFGALEVEKVVSLNVENLT